MHTEVLSNSVPNLAAMAEDGPQGPPSPPQMSHGHVQNAHRRSSSAGNAGLAPVPAVDRSVSPGYYSYGSRTYTPPPGGVRSSMVSTRRFVGTASSHSSASSIDGLGGGQHSRRESLEPGANVFDLTQTTLAAHLAANPQSLMPRIKTIELYRKNAKRSNDPQMQFQFAQFMLQTALLSGGPSGAKSATLTSTAPSSASSTAESSTGSDVSSGSGGNAKKRQSTLFGGTTKDATSEEKIKADLLKEAVANLRRLTDKGYADAQYLLGDAYASGALGKPELKESFRLFSLAAKHGHAEAAYRAALCLEEGWGVSKDIRRAVQFLKTAASRNQPGAMLRLGMSMFYGRMGFDERAKTKQEGIKWLTRAADAANEIFPQGPFELARIYEVGYIDVVIRDLSYAVQLYVRSAELGFVPAATKLGHAYEYGVLGCPRDAALSIHYYSMAAEGSGPVDGAESNADPNAMLALCAWLLVGAEPVLPKDEQQAFLWAEKAANLGLAKAQFAVGYFLENGIGTPRDVLQSSDWYKKAAEAGDERAKERLARASPGKKQKKAKDSDCIIC